VRPYLWSWGIDRIMDFRSTVLSRPQEEDEDRLRREKERLSSGPSGTDTGPWPRSPTQHHQPQYSPTKSLPSYSNSYQPPTTAPPSLSSTSHVDRAPVSPLTTSNPTEYPSTTRDRPTSSYYDPTSDSAPPKPSAWSNGHAQTPQVSFISLLLACNFSYPELTWNEEPRHVHSIIRNGRIYEILQRKPNITRDCEFSRALPSLTLPPKSNWILTVAQDDECSVTGNEAE
jgi:hypothetical protein